MIKPTGTLRLLSSHFISSPLLYKKIEEFKKKYPKVILDLRFADGGAKTWKLDKKNIDLLFGFPQIAGVTEDWKYKQVLSESNILVASPKLIKKTGAVKNPEKTF